MKLAAPVIGVVGPTASVKSELAQRLAEALSGEVVSADSMQVYRGMDIGTGKVLPADRRVVHHGLDLIDPGEPFSAALFQTFARARFSDIDSRGKRAILCGGTGFYVRAAIDDYVFPAGEQVGNQVRDHYTAFAREQGAHALWEMLAERDAQSAAIIPENDVKRIVRAFELLEEGTTYARQREQLASIGQVVPALMVGLKVDPEILRERIDRRVDAMFDQGLVDEVSDLLESGFRDAVTAPQAIGYKEVVSALDGATSMEEARAAIKGATRRYAKRQRTWFRKDRRIKWIEADVLDFDRLTEMTLEIIANANA